MSNYVVKNGETVLSAPMPHDDAVKRLDDLKLIYPRAHVEPTDQEAHKVGYVATGEAEVVEDVGCAGGACTL